MNRNTIRHTLLASCVLLASSSQAGFQDLMKSAGGLLDGGASLPGLGGATQASALSSAQIDAGLKEALSVGADRAIALLGASGGFLNDPAVRIPMPGMLEKVADTARRFGQGQYVDQFEQTVNRAAERAVPQTLDIVKQTISGMTLEDAKGVLNGGDDAATQYLREKAGPSLREAVRPIVSQATDQAGATAAYKNLMATSGSSLGALGGMFGAKQTSLDLDSYVTDKTLDGLFLKLAAEEKAIRTNPVARSTDLLKQVFGR